ncbi:MAG TPA: hypothetical protein IAB51_10760 [Candidatus Merdivicinus excrementipullorum]|uniref:DUF6870 domain-containing protein n=1 Tax=Candidatus Merdivicinus excrementipullorum TaxID=2840867 RepID=A0A9D1FNT2_9FIRM|nr:hypothetical protein [Candidatus Merdivicinus excrementipullorum]
MEEYSAEKLSEMQNVDIRTVNKDDLVDLNSVQIDGTLPIPERVNSFIQQIKNPYCFRIGDVAVKVVYKEDGPTFQQNIEDALRTV